MADEFGRADLEWRFGRESFIALPAAAAVVFRQVRGHSLRTAASLEDVNDALNIAASALSRLIEIYVLDEVAHTRAPMKLDVVSGKFVRGASQFQRDNGSTIDAMSVKRADLASALSLISRAGIPFGLAIDREAGEGPPLREREPRAPEQK
jgi:hypothetical protein